MNRADAARLLPWIFPAMLLMPAAEVLWTQRELADSFQQLQALVAPARAPALVWLQRAVSLLLLAASMEQIARVAAAWPSASGTAWPASSGQALSHSHSHGPRGWLLLAFGIFWLGTIGLPAVLGAHPAPSHELAYPLLAGVAVCAVDAAQRDRLLRLARDALVLLMAAGLLLALLRPGLALDTSYGAGLLPGLPRFAGLTQHPVAQGMLAQLALLLLAACPYPRAWQRGLALCVGLTVLLLAQSKTAWIAWATCGLTLRLLRPRRRPASLQGPLPAGAMLACLGVMALTLGLLTLALDTGAQERLAGWMDSSQGTQLITLTGRDQIWAAAAQEWREHPAFGYGLSLWDNAYRQSIGLPQATHAHNQLMDDAARSGTVGALSLIAYALALGVMALRCARASAGLSLALLLALVIRSISEVPLLLLGYGSDLFTHLLLLAVIAGTASAASPRPSAPSTRQGVPA